MLRDTPAGQLLADALNDVAGWREKARSLLGFSHAEADGRQAGYEKKRAAARAANPPRPASGSNEG